MKKWSIVLFVLMSLGQVFAQNATFFLMPEIAQANLVNPAIQNDEKIIIGVPGLSSLHLHMSNTVCSFNDAFVKQADDSYEIDYDNVVPKMKGIEVFDNEINYTILFAGFKRGDDYFTFAVNERLLTFATLSSDFLHLIWEGNATYPDANLDETSIRSNHTREYILGWSRKVSRPLTLGVHAKLIFGKTNIYMPKMSGNLSTDMTDYSLNFNLDAKIHSTLPIEVISNADGTLYGINLQDDIDWLDYEMNNSNLGFGCDLGMVYESGNNVFSASLLNLGMTHWKSQSNGIDVEGDYKLSEITPGTTLNEINDSIKENVALMTNTDDYSSFHIPEVYLGVSHTLSLHLKAGLVLHSRLVRQKLYPSATLSLNTYSYERFTVALSYTAAQENYANIGAGVGVKLGVFYLHAVSDNVLGLLSIKDTRYANFRVGLAFTIPEKNPHTSQKETSSSRTGNCNCHDRWEGRRQKK